MPPSARRNVPFVVAYTYTGFPMVMLARELVHGGAIGEVRKVEAWYPQGWLATKLEADGQKQASWRVDPSQGRRLGLRRRHRHARLRVRPVRRRPVGHAAPRPAQDVRPRPGARRRFHRPGRAQQRRRSPRSPPRRSPSAPRTTTASASAARPGRSNGRSPTTPILKHYAGGQPLQALSPGGRIRLFPRPRSSRTSASPRATPKASTRRWPTCTGRSNGRSAAARREGPHAVRAPGHRRRRRRHGVHRGRRRQLEAGRRMGRSPQGRDRGEEGRSFTCR